MIKFSDIKVLVLDVDGTLTDGMYQISDERWHGSTMVTKSFYTRDFSAIQKIAGIMRKIWIVTQSHDVVIAKQIRRICDHSDIWKTMVNYESLRVFAAIDDKEKLITQELAKIDLGWDNVAYMGDAENDLPPMKKSLFTGCPADAIEEVRENSNYISDFPGGRGAVYDFCMKIYNENDKENR
jgi:3-deoxy-D-manno-octulosonate 8-phosphate phosphatase (KDO 8-P phosphatase)